MSIMSSDRTSEVGSDLWRSPQRAEPAGATIHARAKSPASEDPDPANPALSFGGALSAAGKMPAKTTPSLSVVIRCCNEARHIGKLLHGLRLQSIPHEVVVVDSGSTDGTVEI
ncbi:MAG: glycosyltransferase, partial [Phycisphaerales bacterium]|nr:glycosyltransferase [Phycisphaerales bacterium]